MVAVGRGGFFAASSYKGNVLIQCTHSGDPSGAAAEREQADEKRDAAARAFAFCKGAYESAGDMAATWSDWFGGQAVTAPPDRSQFMYLCGVVDDLARHCLDPDYAQASGEPCTAQFAKLSNERRRALDRLLVTRDASGASSAHE